jgi:hypothetical protein
MLQAKVPTPATRLDARRLMGLFTPPIINAIAKETGIPSADVDVLVYEFCELSAHLETDVIKTIHPTDTDAEIVRKGVNYINMPLTVLRPLEHAVRSVNVPAADPVTAPTPPDLTEDEKKDD